MHRLDDRQWVAEMARNDRVSIKCTATIINFPKFPLSSVTQTSQIQSLMSVFGPEGRHRERGTAVLDVIPIRVHMSGIDTWPNCWALCLATDRHARFRPFSKNRSTD